MNSPESMAAGPSPGGPGARRSWAGVAWRWMKRLMLTVVVVLVAYLGLTPTGHYLLRAGWEEALILKKRQPIVDIVRDSAITPLTRQKLQLVLSARGFAEDSIGLKTMESFTTFTQLDSDTLVLVLSGAYKDRLRSKTWWFPIVGRVPYKGYFDVEQAKAAAKQLGEEGFDVYLRPASAFSTLGWFNDPLLSTTLRADSIDLVNTVIHEVTHNTFYASGSASFNESFANFVGARGSAWFFRSRGSPQAASQADDRWSDEKLMAGFWAQLYRTIDSTFTAHPDDRERRISLRDSIYRAARQTLVHDLGPRMRIISPRALERVRLDNGAVMARRVYLTDVEVFDAVFAREQGDLKAAIGKIIELAKSDPKKPFDAVRKYVGMPPAPVPQR